MDMSIKEIEFLIDRVKEELEFCLQKRRKLQRTQKEQEKVKDLKNELKYYKKLWELQLIVDENKKRLKERKK